MLTARRDGVVVRALEVKLAPEVLGQVAALCGVEGGLPLSMGEGCVDLAVVVWLVLARAGKEVGQLAQKDVELNGAAPDGNGFNGVRHAVSACVPSMARVRIGSAFEITTGAAMRSPDSSRTPSPGRISATGTPDAMTAPASCAASAM